VDHSFQPNETGETLPFQITSPTKKTPSGKRVMTTASMEQTIEMIDFKTHGKSFNSRLHRAPSPPAHWGRECTLTFNSIPQKGTESENIIVKHSQIKLLGSDEG